MLFSSPVFIFYFLPVVLGLALTLRNCSNSATPFISLVCIASLCFYSYSNPAWLPLILASIAANYFLGSRIATSQRYAKSILIAGICFNLGLLGYFKYADFLIVTTNNLFGIDQNTLNVILPIGISFYTFQQIAYLVDVYHNPELKRGLTSYAFFVSFFPQLIAGPIVHHSQLIPQLANVKQRNISDDLAIGLCLFFMGLAKKVLIADSLGQYANTYFIEPDVGFTHAWLGVSAYSLQIYFDFSGYSDMALGLGLMFGLKLPVNFDSPYQARSIIDFWRRWHITLSNFLKDYLYIPLGGNRRGDYRRFSNLLITMLLGGLWHGAGWGFVLWGGLHGLYLCLNHWLRHLSLPKGLAAFGWPLTLIAVIFAWVPFRAADFSDTWFIWQTMLGLGAVADASPIDMKLLTYLMLGWLVAAFSPNSQQFINYIFPQAKYPARPNGLLVTDIPERVRPMFASVVGAAAAIGLALNNRIAEFLYFQF